MGPRLRDTPRPQVAALLRAIRRTGSLRKAARALGIAPGNAHRVVRTEERRLRRRLVLGTTGGRTGGGSRLTPAGRKVAGGRRGLSALTVTWWPCRLGEVPKKGSPLWVVIPDAGVTAFVAPIGTRIGWFQSLRADAALVLRIAPEAVTIVARGPQAPGSARNVWPARVVRVRRPLEFGIQFVELAVGAKRLVVSVTASAVEQLRLRAGTSVALQLKATALRLRVPAP